MNIGIIGAGDMAKDIAITLQGLAKNDNTKDIRAYAIASRSIDKASQFAETWGFEKAYGCYEDIVNDPDVDLVYVATPHSHHYAHAKLALEHNKNCLIEKAFTANSAQAEELISIARNKHLLLAEAIFIRYLPLYKTLRKILDSGELGNIRCINANIGFWMKYKERLVKPELCGGALLDVGVYAINFVRMFCNRKWEKVISNCIKGDTGVDELDNVSVILDNGVMANMNISSCSMLNMHAVVSCEHGRIEIDNLHDTQIASIKNPRATDYEIQCEKLVNGFEYELIACRDALRNKQMEITDMPHAEILEVMRIMDKLRKEWGVVYPENVENI